jgi:3',5'-cyclic AMP phosphodiesterase CpdA
MEAVMRVLATSDLHYSIRWEEAVEAFADEVVAEAPDVLIVAGDVGEGLDRFRRCLGLFDRLPPATLKLVLAGNHDVWTREGEPRTSLDLLERDLPAAARDAGFVWLETDVAVRGRTAFAGSLAWYDWSGAWPGISDAEILAHKRAVWVDAWRVDWPHADKDMARRLGEGLTSRLAALEARPDIDRVIVATHVPPWSGGLQRRPEYAVTAAFFVNLGLGERLLPFGKVSHAVAGHIHRGARQAVERPKPLPPIDFRIIPSDYGEPAAVRFEVGE